ncbi:helix-turn-helix domain-containing protein [Sphaerotilus microaerophilus]|uniref:HTH iclR-type domain-containing protein n=1 Tax=Sphaerotilus microaerophilus TaxID=2914710 RepID=A0ABN6PNG2_9BURK|nr:helix-turn-helix domain-containing protein [Sphaerotilus sp. FB-5]BDI05617.1 hypothetical protein CATMQ487_25870 [Sphaerotilus sp. FB-5]
MPATPSLPSSAETTRPGAADAIRAVVRALRLLRLMNERPVWTLHELHQASTLPKATLSRLLATLRLEGYVAAEATPGLYRLAGKVRELDGGYTEGSRLVDAGRPILLQVTREIKWPLALATLDVDAMVVRFSSMPYSPLAVHTTTLAVPVCVAGEAVAALSMTTFGRSMTAAVVERHRPILAETAQAIAAAFSADGS